MKSNRIVVYRVSAKAGHIRSSWVQEERADGWVRVTRAADPGRDVGTWIAPQNVITFTDPHHSYDYGGIPEGALVQVFDEVGMVVRRRGARYDILIDGSVRDMNWDLVRPVEDPCNTPQG